MPQEVIGKPPVREALEQQSANRKREALRKVANLIVAQLIEHGRLTSFTSYSDDTVYVGFVIGSSEYRITVDRAERDE